MGAGARGGGGEGWLTSACAPSRECIHISERERDFILFGQGLHWLLKG